MTNKIAFITGATSGIGKACAEKFAAKNYNVIITGRRKELLESFAEELKKKFSVEILTLNYDIRKFEENEKAVASLTGKWREIDVLVNNAGLAAGLSAFQDGKISDWERMIDTNIKGLLYISRLISPIMIERGKGHIINIGSIAGKETYANGNVYCATKHAVDSLTKAMRIDLLKYNIKVTAIHPGAVETEFSLVRFAGDKQAAENVYKGFKPLTGSDIAEAVYYVTALPEHVNINDMIIVPTAQANTVHLNKHV
jgi:3-hydroxy acid dehydrogenase / malonic semialdehyde reductase